MANTIYQDIEPTVILIKEFLYTLNKNMRSKRLRKKNLSASLLGQYTYCPRMAWFSLHGIPEYMKSPKSGETPEERKHSSETTKRLYRGIKAHKVFSRKISRALMARRLIATLCGVVMSVCIIGVIRWMLTGSFLR